MVFILYVGGRLNLNRNIYVVDANNEFIRDLTTNVRPLGEYMEKAGNNEEFDFKVTNGIPGQTIKEHFRGMPIQLGSNIVIASARDIGNYVAGYYAGINGFSWISTRIAFDKYQGGREERQTRSAQFIGWEMGASHPKTEKQFYLAGSIPSLLKYVKKNYFNNN